MKKTDKKLPYMYKLVFSQVKVLISLWAIDH